MPVPRLRRDRNIGGLNAFGPVYLRVLGGIPDFVEVSQVGHQGGDLQIVSFALLR